MSHQESLSQLFPEQELPGPSSHSPKEASSAGYRLSTSGPLENKNPSEPTGATNVSLLLVGQGRRENQQGTNPDTRPGKLLIKEQAGQLRTPSTPLLAITHSSTCCPEGRALQGLDDQKVFLMWAATSTRISPIFLCQLAMSLDTAHHSSPCRGSAFSQRLLTSSRCSWAGTSGHLSQGPSQGAPPAHPTTLTQPHSPRPGRQA